MIIETKLDVGDEVYFIQNSKVYVAEIAEVSTRTHDNTYRNTVTATHYVLVDNPAGTHYSVRGFDDTDLFKTKAELLETL